MSAKISARFLGTDAAKPRPKPYEIHDSNLRGFILRVQPSGVRSYYARLTNKHRVLIGRAGVLTPEEARERCAQIIGNVALGRPPTAGLDSAAAMTFGQFIDEVYEPWLKLNRPRRAAKTMYPVRQHFAQWNNYPLKEITHDLIDKWMTTEIGKGSKPSSVRRNVDSLAGVLRRAVKSGKLEESPMRRVEKPKLDRTPKVRYLSDAEEARLRAALKARDAKMISARGTSDALRMRKKRGSSVTVQIYGDHLTPAVLLSINTGMRLGELLALRWDNVDFRQRVATLEGGVTKSGQTRHAPLNKEAIHVLKAWQAETTDAERVFPFAGGFKTAWKALLKAAKISRFRWHDQRHHFASRLAMKGVPLNTIRELLGHASITMVLRYAHLSPNETHAAVDLL